MSSVEDWTTKVDDSGRTFFFNPKTQESRWDDPRKSESSWQVLMDDATGRKYYFNPKSGESRWDKPAEVHSSAPVISSTTAAPPPTLPGAAPAAAPAAASPGGATEGKSMPSRASRRASMLPETTKAAARRSVLAAAQRLRNDDKAASANADGNDKPAAKPSGAKKGGLGMVAAQLGRWRYRGKGNTTSGLSLDGAKGLPVRETLQGMYKINRDKTLKEACIFLVWSCLFVTIVYTVNDVHLTYSTNDALIDLFLDEEFADANYKKNFYEIYTMGEYWTFLRGPVFEGLYVDEFYNGQAFNETEQGYLLNYLRLVGGVQLRQARVASDSCKERRFLSDCIDNADGICIPRFDTKDGSCYADFTISRQDTEPFGPPEDPTRYQWSGGHSVLEGLYNFGPDYGTGGYVTELPLNRTAAGDIVDQLFDDLWTDQGTRSVLVSFNLYNTNTKLMSTVRILVEFFASGHLVRSFKFFTIKLVVYQSRIDTLRMVGEFLFIVFWVYYLQKEIRTLIYHKPFFLYFTRFRNLFEVLFLGFNAAAIIAWLRFILDPLKRDFTVEATQFVDMFPLAEKYMTVYTLAGFIGLVACLKVFKFLSISKKMNALWLTLFRAAPDLIAFIVGFVVLVSGFAFMASMLFGFQLVDFHNFLASFSTLLRFPLGDFDYDSLQIARPAITGIFFTCYVGMVFLVCMNMIIGIVTKYFDEVHHELKFSDKWKISTMSLEAHLLQRAAWACRKWTLAAKGCWRQKCSKSPGSSRNLRAEAKDQRSIMSDKVQADGWSREAAYLKTLHKVMRKAKREKNVDLYAYFDNVYTEHTGTGSIYVGVHELCHLVSPKPCPPSQHFECIARRLLDAYNNVKTVTLVGAAHRHTPQSSVVISRDYKRYEVVKVNRSGIKQNRILVVDTETKSIYNFTSKMRLKKRLPLAQLIQLDSSRTDMTRLSLVFTSQGLTYRSGMGDPDDLETTYDLIFESQELRDAFIAEVSAVKTSLGGPNSVDIPNPMLTGLSRRQMRTEASVRGLGGPRDNPAAVLEEDEESPGAGAGAGGAGTKTAAPAAARASAPSSGSRSSTVTTSQLGVIVEHMRSQRAALRLVMEQLHHLRQDVGRLAP